MTTPYEAYDALAMQALEQSLQELGEREREDFSPAFEDRIFAATRRHLRGSTALAGRGWWATPGRRALAMAAALAVVGAGVVMATVLLRGGSPETTTAFSFDEELTLWVEASESAAASFEFASLRSELDALEQGLERPWPTSGVILDEESM